MKIIRIQLDGEGTVTIDFGGELDDGCCGPESKRLSQALRALGLKMKLNGVRCRLPISQRIKAKLCGTCILNPLKADANLPDLIPREEQGEK